MGVSIGIAGIRIALLEADHEMWELNVDAML